MNLQEKIDELLLLSEVTKPTIHTVNTVSLALDTAAREGLWRGHKEYSNLEMATRGYIEQVKGWKGGAKPMFFTIKGKRKYVVTW